MKNAPEDNTRVIVFCAVVFILYVLDQVAKYLIVSSLELHESLVVIRNFFNVTLVRNPGSVFGLFSGYPFLLGIFSGVVVVLVTLFYHSFTAKNFYLSLASVLVVSGALGNLSDRIRNGYVIDFLDMHIGRYHWPVFNLADSFITAGMVLIIVSLLLDIKSGSKPFVNKGCDASNSL